jgi:hypothetical protein
VYESLFIGEGGGGYFVKSVSIAHVVAVGLIRTR